MAEKLFEYKVDLANKYKAELTVTSVLQDIIIPYISFAPFGTKVPVFPTNLKEILFKKHKKI